MENTNVTSLRDTSSFQIALSLWNCRDIEEIISFSLFSIKIEVVVESENLEKCINALGLPKILQDLVEKKVRWIVEQINDWWGKHARYIGDICPSSSFKYYANRILWKPNGCIDYARTKDNISTDPNFWRDDDDSDDDSSDYYDYGIDYEGDGYHSYDDDGYFDYDCYYDDCYCDGHHPEY